MKNYYVIIVMFFCLNMSAQGNQKLEVQEAIENFFIGFHAQDSIKMKSVAADSLILQTIVKSVNEEYKVKTENFKNFLLSISKIPESVNFEEKILDYNIQIDGAMANAWTKYEFWINDEIKHCGVNSFQLLKEEEGWKIIYLIDTRRKEGCQ